MVLPARCTKCKKRFGLNDTCIKQGQAECPHCGEMNVFDTGGPPIQSKVIVGHLIQPILGRMVYCARCMDVHFMDHSLPRCPDCGSRNIFGIVANFTVPAKLLKRVREDSELVVVARVTRAWDEGFTVYMPLDEMKKLDEDLDV